MVRRKCWEYIDFNIEPFFKYKQRFLWHIWLIFSERFNIVHRPTITYLYRQHSKQQLQHLARKEKDDKQIIRDIQFEALERRRRPRMLDIGLTDKCNLRCIMCPRNDPKIKLSEMDYNDFRKIVDEVPCEEIQLAGALGESLLYKDLFRCIEYCKEKNIRVYLTTNATLLTPDISRRLLDLDIHYISFSVDGATKETYERIRKGAIFEEVVNNIKNFTSLKKKMGKKVIVELVPVIIVGYNDHEISQLIDLGAYLEVDRVCIGDIQYKFDIGVSTKEHSLRLQKSKLIIGEIQKAVKRAVVLGIKVATPRLDISKVWTKCRYPWTMLTVTTHGWVRPCCGTHRKNIGNILREGFDRIWNSKSFYDWRRQMMSENPPLECIHCPMF
jgi:MoaA/NifB/PqqE/SkfB family radical SAM enzyme